MKLHRDLGITQKTAWFMMHRIREAFPASEEAFAGPVEVDETYIGGKRKNMSKSRRRQQYGRGTVGKTTVIGAKDRASNKIAAAKITLADKETLHGFVKTVSASDAKVYTDEAKAYDGIERDHGQVNHSAGEYVRGRAHTNGVESFWALLKRGYRGTFHNFSAKHLNRYVQEFAGRHNDRNSDTIDMMTHLAAGMVGRHLSYRKLIHE